MLQYHWGSIVKKKFVLQTIFWHRLYPSLEWSPSHVREAPSGQIRHGMLRACQNTLRVKENGLVFAGLPCHSFIFLNLATSCRSATCPFGDQEKLYVRQSNGYLGLVYRTYIYIYIYILFLMSFLFFVRIDLDHLKTVFLTLGWQLDCSSCVSLQLWEGCIGKSSSQVPQHLYTFLT